MRVWFVCNSNTAGRIAADRVDRVRPSLWADRPLSIFVVLRNRGQFLALDEDAIARRETRLTKAYFESLLANAFVPAIEETRLRRNA